MANSITERLAALEGKVGRQSELLEALALEILPEPELEPEPKPEETDEKPKGKGK